MPVVLPAKLVVTPRVVFPEACGPPLSTVVGGGRYGYTGFPEKEASVVPASVSHEDGVLAGSSVNCVSRPSARRGAASVPTLLWSYSDGATAKWCGICFYFVVSLRRRRNSTTVLTNVDCRRQLSSRPGRVFRCHDRPTVLQADSGGPPVVTTMLREERKRMSPPMPPRPRQSRMSPRRLGECSMPPLKAPLANNGTRCPPPQGPPCVELPSATPPDFVPHQLFRPPPSTRTPAPSRMAPAQLARQPPSALDSSPSVRSRRCFPCPLGPPPTLSPTVSSSQIAAALALPEQTPPPSSSAEEEEESPSNAPLLPMTQQEELADDVAVEIARGSDDASTSTLIVTSATVDGLQVATGNDVAMSAPIVSSASADALLTAEPWSVAEALGVAKDAVLSGGAAFMGNSGGEASALEEVHKVLAAANANVGNDGWSWLVVDAASPNISSDVVCVVGSAPGCKESEVVVLFDPFRDELFSAVRGKGTELNGRCAQVSEDPDAQKEEWESVSSVPPARASSSQEEMESSVHDQSSPTSATQRLPSASALLNLAWVACGRQDQFYTQEASEAARVAGSLLVVEAGGKLDDCSYYSISLGSKVTQGFYATNGAPSAHRALMQIINPDPEDVDVFL